MINTVEEAITQLRHIQLDSEFSPRQIAHMILAGGPSQSLYNIEKGIHQSALEFLCHGTHEVSRYPIPGGIIKEDSKSRPHFARSTKSFEVSEHQNDLLGMLAVAGVHFSSTAIITEKGTIGTLTDLAETAMQTYSEGQDEPCWSLMVFAVHPGVEGEWRNENGDLCSVEKISESALRLPYGAGSCFGTHNLEAIAWSLSRFCLESDIEPSQLQGVWKQAFEYLEGAVGLMQKNQRDDGSIPRSWFKTGPLPRGSNAWKEQLNDVVLQKLKPPAAIVYPTGHCLDAISTVAPFLESSREMIGNACYITALTIQRNWMNLASEISYLTHAVHALKLLGD